MWTDPKEGKGGEKKKVEKVREFVKNIQGFKSLTYHFTGNNNGLGLSVINGVTNAINQYSKAIVIEDDLIVSKNFLAFMNQGLYTYEKNDKVFSICGYSNKVKIPSDYHYDAYFCPRSSSWGWATWADRWNSCDWQLSEWEPVKKNAKAYNKWGGSDCFSMIKAWHEGRNQSWAIRFCYNQFVQDKVSLFPVISHVKNNGFDGSGEDCKRWSRFKYIFDDSINKKFVFPLEVRVNRDLKKSALSYHSILIRIYSKFMYMIAR